VIPDQTLIVNGSGTGQNVSSGNGSGIANTVINFKTTQNSPPIQNLVSRFAFPKTSLSEGRNLPAYAWVTAEVPPYAAAVSFDFKLTGDAGADSFEAAIQGTNVFSLSANVIETNLLVSSGLIDVSTWRGQTVEMFFGIVGGTSTNVEV
jgi:hypothetical protein